MTKESSVDNDDAPDGAIKQLIDSATSLVKAVPIYEDAVQPFAKEAGKALGTVGEAVNVALSPISLVVWGYDQISEFLEKRVAEKLEGISEDRISTPPTNVAGPAVEALKFAGQDETLRELFANLIANSLDLETTAEAHPSFVDIIRNMSPDEGLILELFSTFHYRLPLIDVKLYYKKDDTFEIMGRNMSMIGTLAKCKHPYLTNSYIDNLCRLGILEVLEGKLKNTSDYEALVNHPSIAQWNMAYKDDEDFNVKHTIKYIQTTSLGWNFIEACVIDKRSRS